MDVVTVYIQVFSHTHYAYSRNDGRADLMCVCCILRWFTFCQRSPLPYLTSGVGRLLHLPSPEAVSVRPNAHPRM